MNLNSNENYIFRYRVLPFRIPVEGTWRLIESIESVPSGSERQSSIQRLPPSVSVVGGRRSFFKKGGLRDVENRLGRIIRVSRWGLQQKCEFFLQSPGFSPHGGALTGFANDTYSVYSEEACDLAERCLSLQIDVEVEQEQDLTEEWDRNQRIARKINILRQR